MIRTEIEEIHAKKIEFNLKNTQTILSNNLYIQIRF
jgi:hypothetical protein